MIRLYAVFLINIMLQKEGIISRLINNELSILFPVIAGACGEEKNFILLFAGD